MDICILAFFKAGYWLQGYARIALRLKTCTLASAQLHKETTCT